MQARADGGPGRSATGTAIFSTACGLFQGVAPSETPGSYIKGLRVFQGAAPIGALGKDLDGSHFFDP
eukprot:8346250-Pyramimonas_sp.AAC.1